MKKKLNALLSIFFALVLLVQLCPAALADAPSGEESLAVQVYVLDAEGSSQLLTEESKAALLGEKDYALKLDGEDLPAAMTLKALLDGDLRVTPPEGFFLKQMYLRGSEDVEKIAPLVLDGAAETGPERFQVILGGGRFDKDGNIDASRISSETKNGVYTLVLVFAPVDTEAKHKIVFDANGVEAELEDSECSEGGTVYAPALSQALETAAAAAKKVFRGWLLVYPSGVAVSLEPGEGFMPYDDCVVRARWADVITITANTPVDNGEGGAETAGFTVSGNLASGDGVAATDVSLTLKTQDGEYSAVPSNAVIRNAEGEIATADYELVYVESPAMKPAASGGGEGGSSGGESGGSGSGSGESGGSGGDELTPEVIELTITAGSGEKVYDGKPLKASDLGDKAYSAAGLASGHELQGVKVSGEALKPDDAGVTKVDVTELKIVDSSDGNKDVTDKYTVKTVDGKLSIKKRSLVITAISEKQPYCGQTIKAASLEKDGFTDGYSIGGDGVAEGQTVGRITVSGEGLTVGEYTTSIDKPGEITVSIDAANQVTGCYDIKTEDGKLIIEQRPLTITAISGTAKYTGSTIYAKNYSGNGGFKKGAKAEGLVEGHSLDGDFVLGSGVEEDFVTSIDKSKVKVLDAAKNDVTGQYDIKTENGLMKISKTVTQTPITVTANASKVYDGTPLTISNSDIMVTDSTLPSDYTITAVFSRKSITDAQTVEVTLSQVTIKDGKGNDVTSQYKIKTEPGTMSVKPKPLTLTAESDSKAYDGKALINKNVRATALASKNHTLSVEYEITNKDGKVIKNGAVDVGTYTKKITSVVIKDGNTDVTSNYEIKTVDGTLTITAAGTSANTAKPNAKSPKTGDESGLLLWVSVMAISALIVLSFLLTLYLLNKKRGLFRKK